MMPTPKPPRLSLLLYRLLLVMLTPYLWWRFRREGQQYQDTHFALQRLGYGHPALEAPLWLHAASVGEVNAILPLIEALHRNRPVQPLLLTTNTASSGALARKKLPPGVMHAYLPFDRRGGMKRFLQQCRPKLGLIVETELWPNLYGLCAETSLPLVIVNGRVSAKTLRAPAWLRRLYRYCLACCSAVLCRAQGDEEGYLALGADGERTRVVGNIKFAALNEEPPEPLELGRDYVLAASTRDDEERLIVEAWRQSGREELLVIAPRHPQRLEAILDDLAPFKLDIAVRSRGEAPIARTRIYLADTFGELRRFMAGARLIFMGGSLVAKGGHNLLEPAALGKAVVTGPHMENFADETHRLLAGEGVVQIESVEALGQTFANLVGDEMACNALGERAMAVLARESGVVERYLEALNPYL